MRTRIIIAALSLLFFPCSRGPAHAQATVPQQTSRVPVTVALMDHPQQADISFVIARRTTGSDQDVIILPSTADAALLSRAVQVLLLARRIEGDTATQASNIREQPRETGNVPPRVLPWAQRVLTDLRNGGRRGVVGVGTVRAVRIWLPQQHHHAR